MHWNTVTPVLRDVLGKLMQSKIFQPFRLVGGTSLSLQFGHRESVDIDLFTDAAYDSIDFDQIRAYFHAEYSFVSSNEGLPVALGSSWYIGPTSNDAVKIDLYYTDPFIRPHQLLDGVRMAAVEDIIAMKLDVIGRGGRMKDFWDIHLLHEHFPIKKMIALYQERYPYGFTSKELKKGLVDFEMAENDLMPNCLLGKHWPLIKLDFINWLQKN